jgi:antitoxin YefM
MGYVNFTEFRAKLASHFDKLAEDRVELVVTRQGHEEMVVLPLRELESLRETIHLLGNPANASMLRESISQLEAGKGIKMDVQRMVPMP